MAQSISQTTAKIKTWPKSVSVLNWRWAGGVIGNGFVGRFDSVN